MILKDILCVQHFCNFGAMLFIVNVSFVFLICLSMFVISHFLYKIADLEDIVNWLNFV